jgi:MOSC domain-containing protein YiiM
MENKRSRIGTVLSVNISEKKGQKKQGVGRAVLREGLGLENDAHAGMEIRQVSLLAEESIDKIRAKGLDVRHGDFAENLTTKGIILHELPVGTRFTVGENIVLELTQIGKICHDRCAIYAQVGDCVMPREGVFAKVITGGEVKAGDAIRVDTP